MKAIILKWIEGSTYKLDTFSSYRGGRNVRYRAQFSRGEELKIIYAEWPQGDKKAKDRAYMQFRDDIQIAVL